MSVDASGTYGKAMTFAKWKGRNYVRERVVPTNPQSAKQVGVRGLMKFLSQAWAAISAPNKATWDALAAATSISAFNAFMAHNLNRWQNFLSPTQANPAAGASTGLTITTHTITGGVGQTTHSITPSGGTSIWGYAIFRELSVITTPSWANCIAVIPANGASAVTYVDSPLAAATYHYRVAAINVDGVMGAVHADATGVAT